jgi:DNA-binding SARP family transcriptional activator/TolB-like protein/Flp pilus assembly protein TadD
MAAGHTKFWGAVNMLKDLTNKPGTSGLERSNVVPLDVPWGEASRQGSPRSIVRIHLLGPMRATTYLGDNVLPRGKKARAILAFLCLASGARVPRAKLASMLWDRATDGQARTSLRQALREITAALGSFAEEIISGGRDSVRLDTALCWTDAVALVAPGPSALNSPRGDLASLCAGELLEGLDGASASFDQWLLGERTRFSDRLRELLETELQGANGARADAKQLASTARRLIAFDPTHEGASRVLMRALADMGERAQALKEYARCRDALQRGLDLEPSPETQALYEAIRGFGHREDRDKVPASPARLALPARAVGHAPGCNRLRVGVLPFLGTRSPNDETLGFSLSQEIAAALARFRWFDVIAPVSLMRRPAARLMSEDQLQQKELDYVVDGALSGNGKAYQISVRLLDLAQYARPVWSHRFELAVGELHRVDELVTARIVGQIDPVILHIEGQPRRRSHYGATGLLLLAIPLILSAEREKFKEAGELIERALALDPDDAMVATWAAHWQVFSVGQGWSEQPASSFAAAQRHALRAIKLDPDNAEALGIYAHICAFLDKDFDSAIYYFDRALRLNPNLAYVWAFSAMTYCYIGEPLEALRRLQRYRDLAPFDPSHMWYENFFTVAYMFAGKYDKAVTVGRRAIKHTPGFSNAYKPLIAALGHLRRHEEAKPYIAKLLELEPNFSIRKFAEVYPFKYASDRDRYITGLRLAGVPEN